MTSKSVPSKDAYALVAEPQVEIAAPEVPYQPPMPEDRSTPIGLIGAGGISSAHLDAYRNYGLNVVAICDHALERAAARRDEFFPKALATNRVEDILSDDRIAVVDLALHPTARVDMIRQSLDAGKHVLSQKPFVSDVRIGTELVELAGKRQRLLAVNQNGRWAPYMSYLREAVASGMIGDVISVHAQLQWDHSWIQGTPFEEIDQIILEDFAIHWFDFLVSLIGDTATSVYAIGTKAKGQEPRSRLMAQAMVAFPGGQASLVFDGAAKFGAQNLTTIVGTGGTLRSAGPDLGEQKVTVCLPEGTASPVLKGKWFNDGFAGAMGALLKAVETGGMPINNARDNLTSLKLVYAALNSAKSGGVVYLQ